MNTHPKIIGFVVVTLGVLAAFYLITIGVLLLTGIMPDANTMGSFAHVGDSVTGAFVALLINTRQATPPPPDTSVKKTLTEETLTPPATQ